MRITTLSTLFLAASLVALTGFAQQPGETKAKDAEKQAKQSQRSKDYGQQGDDQTAKLAGWLANSNQAEVEISKFAVKHAQDERVMRFAKRMVEDHAKFVNELRKFMPEVELKREAGEETARGKAKDSGKSQKPKPAAKRAKAGHDMYMRIGIKANQNKIKFTKQVLEEYEGQDFDMGYLGQQISAHINMLSLLDAMKDQGIKTAKARFNQAVAISTQLEDQEGGAEAARNTRKDRDRKPRESN